MKKSLVVVLFAALMLVGCDFQPSSEEIQNVKQEQINKQAVQSVGMPNIIHFFEKRLFKTILELRDQGILTYTYTGPDYQGKFHFLCNSVGYPIPYSTQYTNPMQPGSYTGTTIPQADPNGLYSPSSAEGTYILCQNPNNSKESKPVYSEPRLTTLSWPKPGALPN